MAREIDGLLFDKDGTLFHFRATWEAWAQKFLVGLAGGDHLRAADLGHVIGFDLAAARFAADSVVIAGTAAEVAATLAPHMPDTDPTALLTAINTEASAAPQVEAAPLIPLLTGLRQRGLKLGVATNDAEAPARAHLDAARVTGLFDFIAGYDSGHGAKPGHGQLLAFAQSCALHPLRVAMVGDSTHDLKAGRAAGMRCVAVLTGLAERDALAPYADVVLDDISGLPDWLDAQDRS